MKKALVLLLSLLFLVGAAGFHFEDKVDHSSKSGAITKGPTPANEDKIAKMLFQKGVLKKGASQAKVAEAVKKYLNQKISTKSSVNAMTKEQLLNSMKESANGNVKYQNMFKGNKLGKNINNIDGLDFTQMKDKPWTVKEQEWKGEVRQPKMLILLAEFGTDTYGVGPKHNQIQQPGPVNNTDLWVSDFSKEHYQKMLFTEGGYTAIDQNGKDLKLDSMVDYYLEQSGGSFKVSGNAYGWFTLPHSEAYYGDDDAADHDNMLPGTPADLVSDLLSVAKAQGNVPFEDYDIEDVADFDEDGNYDEPDGIIDHLVIVHAGVDQSGGGGLQGDNAIWAHSSSVWVEIPSDKPTTDYWKGNMIANNYIIQGEDGGIGVFCHEFGHDIGLPDEYDTIYSGNGEAVGFYSLMSSGSWNGQPLGTKPAPMSPWARWQLGQIWGGKWVQPTEINAADIPNGGKVFKLDQTTSVGVNNQAIKVNLPKFKLQINTPQQGSLEWFGGKGDEIDTKLTTTAIDLPISGNIILNFWTMYNIEQEWDFGFVQISEDNGATWKSLSTGRTTGTIVTSGYPAIKNNMPGYTGDSGGWVNEIIDLSAYAGKTIKLQFRYMTDWGTSLSGFFVDSIKVTAGTTTLFEDNAEVANPKLTANGWTTMQGYELKNQYYFLEWRNNSKTDAALKYAYNYTDSVNGIAEFFRYEPGMLVWYRNTAYTDNWTAEHPGYGMLGVVDSHPLPMIVNRTPVRTRIQINDASFSLDNVLTKKLTLFGVPTTISGTANPEFSDSKTYWYQEAPDAGLKVPNVGLRFRVLRNSSDYSVGEVGIYKK